MSCCSHPVYPIRSFDSLCLSSLNFSFSQPTVLYVTYLSLSGSLFLCSGWYIRLLNLRLCYLMETAFQWCTNISVRNYDVTFVCVYLHCQNLSRCFLNSQYGLCNDVITISTSVECDLFSIESMYFTNKMQLPDAGFQPSMKLW
jgi:hypothetical protein